MGKSDGVINLRKPFNVPLWEQHVSGQRHRVNVQRHDTITEMRKETGAFVPTTKTNNINRVHENTAGSSQSPPNLSSPPLGEKAKDSSGINLPPTIPRENSKLHADCCGLFNCIRDKHSTILPAIHTLVNIHGKRKYEWGTFAGMPAIRSSGCNGSGTINVDKLGMMCAPCHDLRRAVGSSNPRQFVNGWANKLEKCFERRKKSELTKQDIDDAKAFANVHDDYLTLSHAGW
jgi:hypothetical protein